MNEFALELEDLLSTLNPSHNLNLVKEWILKTLPDQHLVLAMFLLSVQKKIATCILHHF